MFYYDANIIKVINLVNTADKIEIKLIISKLIEFSIHIWNEYSSLRHFVC